MHEVELTWAIGCVHLSTFLASVQWNPSKHWFEPRQTSWAGAEIHSAQADKLLRVVCLKQLKLNSFRSHHVDPQDPRTRKKQLFGLSSKTESKTNPQTMHPQSGPETKNYLFGLMSKTLQWKHLTQKQSYKLAYNCVHQNKRSQYVNTIHQNPQ